MGDKAAEVTRGQMDSATLVRTCGFFVTEEGSQEECEPGLVLAAGWRGGCGRVRTDGPKGQKGECQNWRSQFMHPGVYREADG